MSGTTPPGWYDDGQGSQRWWDGVQWGPVQGQAPSQPPAQAFGAQPGYGPPQSGYGNYGAPAQAPQKKTALILGIVGAVVVIGVIVTVLLLVLGGGDGPSSDDPAETVQAFLDAGKDSDCDAVEMLVTGEAKEQFESEDCSDAAAQAEVESLGLDPDQVSFEVGEATVDGDTATVPVVVSYGGELPEGLPAEAFTAQTIDYELAKVDGAWLISSFGFDASDFVPQDLPSGLPSDFPTDAFPTDGFPTDGFPTDGIPSDLFSDFPTELFSDFPTELFSDFPTDGFPTQ